MPAHDFGKWYEYNGEYSYSNSDYKINIFTNCYHERFIRICNRHNFENDYVFFKTFKHLPSTLYLKNMISILIPDNFKEFVKFMSCYKNKYFGCDINNLILQFGGGLCL